MSIGQIILGLVTLAGTLGALVVLLIIAAWYWLTEGGTWHGDD